MCNTTSRKELMIKIMIILSLFCLAECASGACMTYGHACWGAHGKRSDNSHLPFQKDEHRTLKSKWFLSRLIQSPLDLRILRESDFDISNQQNNEAPFSLDDVDTISSKQEQWHTNHEMMPDSEDQLFDDNYLPAEESSRIRLPKLLEKRSPKLN